MQMIESHCLSGLGQVYPVLAAVGRRQLYANRHGCQNVPRFEIVTKTCFRDTKNAVCLILVVIFGFDLVGNGDPVLVTEIRISFELIG